MRARRLHLDVKRGPASRVIIYIFINVALGTTVGRDFSFQSGLWVVRRERMRARTGEGPAEGRSGEGGP